MTQPSSARASTSFYTVQVLTPVEQDVETPEIDEVAFVERMTLIARDEAVKVPSPGKEPLDLPAPSVAPQ